MKITDLPLHALIKLGNTLEEAFSEAEKQIKNCFSVKSGVSTLTAQTKAVISELKKLDTLLTEIGKADSSLTAADLDKLGSAALNAAAKYNKAASDYLKSFKTAALAGYENAKGIAELSLAIQNAGGLSAELAESLISATDQAYSLGGSVEELTEILNSAYSIASNNAIRMDELAKGMAAAGSQADKLGISADKTAAALATIMLSTRQSGAEAAEALTKILLYLSQTAAADRSINPIGLTRYEQACRALNVSLKETENGIVSLRDPMSILHDLAESYTKLDSGSKQRKNLLASVGGGDNADALDALLSGYGTYETILQNYLHGMNSMDSATQQTSDSWEGSLKRLANTWTQTVGNVMDPDTIVPVIDALNSLASTLNNITGHFGSIGSIGLGAGLFAGIKNVGAAQLN